MIRASSSRRRQYQLAPSADRRDRRDRGDRGAFLTPRLYPEALWAEPVPATVRTDRGLYLTPRLQESSPA